MGKTARGIWGPHVPTVICSLLLLWMLWVELLPPKTHMLKSSAPVTQNVTFFWRSGLYRNNHVTLKSPGWALIQYNWCLYKKGKIQRQTHTEEEATWRWARCCDEPRSSEKQERGLAPPAPPQPAGRTDSGGTSLQAPAPQL